MSYDYGRVCATFIEQHSVEDKTARMSDGTYRLSFKGNRLYSYDSLLAIIIDDTVLIDKHIGNYSTTSSKQMSKLQTAIKSADMQSFSIYNLDNYQDSLQNYWDDIEFTIRRHSTARMKKQLYLELSNQLYHKATDFTEWAHIDKRTKVYKYKLTIFNKLFEAGILKG